MKEHHYKAKITWTGNIGEGTRSYQTYSRNHIISITHKPDILGSSDPVFLGDISRYNPEEMLVASLSACHMLWYLHLCSERHIVVVDYADHATGTMIESTDGGGRFKEVILNPIVMINNPKQIDLAISVHNDAHHKCFIANSCNFPVIIHPVCLVQGA
ncbi:MAG: OsmC family protein [Bacteroidota bacterium]|nr:OsmC family protein [Bacteroidota bacterium]